MSFVTSLASRRESAEPVVCPTCSVHYRPALTRHACPVCDTDAPGTAESVATGRAWSDPDTRVVAIVVAATALNLILLAVLVIIASNS